MLFRSIVAFGSYYDYGGEGYFGPGYITAPEGITAYDLEADGIYAEGEEGFIHTIGDIIARGGGESGSVIATWDITSENGTIDVYNGELFSHNGSISAGHNILVDYGIYAGGGSITAGNNIVNFYGGDIFAQSDITATNGHIRNDSGSIIANGGDITAGTNVRADYGDIVARADEIEGGGNITAGNSIDAENIYADGNIIAHNGNITAKTTNMEEGGEELLVINAFSNEPIFTGTIEVGGDTLSAANGTIRADRIYYSAGSGTLNINSQKLRVG